MLLVRKEFEPLSSQPQNVFVLSDGSVLLAGVAGQPRIPCRCFCFGLWSSRVPEFVLLLWLKALADEKILWYLIELGSIISFELKLD